MTRIALGVTIAALLLEVPVDIVRKTMNERHRLRGARIRRPSL
jgi:hypothetical protein